MSEYIKKDDLDDTVLRLNNDGWGITRNEHKLISNVLYEMPLYSFPEEKGEWELDESDNSVRCKKCGCFLYPSDISDGEAHFCPNCGAEMRGSKE